MPESALREGEEHRGAGGPVSWEGARGYRPQRPEPSPCSGESGAENYCDISMCWPLGLPQAVSTGMLCFKPSFQGLPVPAAFSPSPLAVQILVRAEGRRRLISCVGRGLVPLD